MDARIRRMPPTAQAVLRHTLPTRIRTARLRAGMSQAALAAAAGVSPSTVCELESGLADPRIGTLLMVCSVLRISPGAVLA